MTELDATPDLFGKNIAAAYLRSSSDHVLDEVTMSGGVNDSDIVLGSLELPQSDVNGDASLTLGLQLVQDPGVLKGSLAGLGGLLLELLNGPLVDTSTLVDQMTSGGGLARVDVADDDNVDVSLFLTHDDQLECTTRFCKRRKVYVIDLGKDHTQSLMPNELFNLKIIMKLVCELRIYPARW